MTKIFLFFAVVSAAVTVENWRSGGRTRELQVSTDQQSSALVEPLRIDFSPAAVEHRRSRPHPHGDKVCASGCALSRHPTPRLADVQFRQLLRDLNDSSTHDAAIDQLLYYGPQTRAKLLTDSAASALLSNHDRTLLTEELERTHAVVSFRLVSEEGEILADLPPQIVPLDVRHEFDLDVHGIPPLFASGTVKRVGQHRLWNRL